jgi:hypothetical protein
MEPEGPLRVHNSPPLDPILSQMSPVNTFTTYFLKILFNIILPPTTRFDGWSLPIRFLDQILVLIFYLYHGYHMTIFIFAAKII